MSPWTQGLAAPGRPAPICADFDRDKAFPHDEFNIQKAFRDSTSTYPISMFHGRKEPEKQLMRSLVIGRD